MPQSRRLAAIIERGGDGYTSLCPELDIASQGDTLEEARANLVEALTLFFETADASEVGAAPSFRPVRDPGRGPGWVSFATAD